jgi:hypothetical protein
MTRYFFHMRDRDVLVRDPDGSELSDLVAAIGEAKLGARAIMAADIEHGRPVRPIAIEITDAAEQVLKIVTFREVLDELAAPLYARRGSRC